MIDGIGVQGHAFSTRPGAPITAVLDLLAETGLPIQVTEMDVDGNPTLSDLISDALSDQNQLDDMQRIFPALWEHPAVEGITLWGWKPGLWRTEQEAYLVRANGEERPALLWMREYIEGLKGVASEADTSPSDAFRLDRNYPNPFNFTTRIRYTLAEPAPVTLTVYDLLGREVSSLVDASQSAGPHEVVFDAGDLPSGIYLYRLVAGASVQAKQMVVLK